MFLDLRLNHSGNTTVLLLLVLWHGVFTDRTQITHWWQLDFSLPKCKMFPCVWSLASWKLNYSWQLDAFRPLIRKKFCDISIIRLPIKVHIVQNILPLSLFLHLQNDKNIGQSHDNIIGNTEGNTWNVVMFNNCSFQFKNNISLTFLSTLMLVYLVNDCCVTHYVCRVVYI